jgi:hypothetical protein
MRRLRYALRIVTDLCAFARARRAWWLIPLLALLAVFGALALAGQGAAPLIYTLF